MSTRSTAKWEVDVKGRANGSGFEISVVRKDNQLGHNSWGWFHPDEKLVVASSELVRIDGQGTIEQLERWTKMAAAIAEILNAKGPL